MAHIPVGVESYAEPQRVGGTDSCQSGGGGAADARAGAGAGAGGGSSDVNLHLGVDLVVVVRAQQQFMTNMLTNRTLYEDAAALSAAAEECVLETRPREHDHTPKITPSLY